MTTIRKKVWPEHFSAVSSGAKPFEVRLADEQVQVGDTLVLEEWSPEVGYTGRSIERKVCSVLPLRDLPYWPREQVEAVGLQVIGFEVAPALAREVQRLQAECIDLHSALDLSCEREARAHLRGQEAMRERCVAACAAIEEMPHFLEHGNRYCEGYRDAAKACENLIRALEVTHD